MKKDRFQDGITSFTNSLANTRSGTATNGIRSSKISYIEMNEAYKTGLGNKIINLKINTAYKEGIKIDGEEETTPLIKSILKEAKEASRWALAFGRGIVVIIEKNTRPEQELSKSINLKTATIRAFDGSMVSVQNTSVDVTSEYYQRPEFYIVRGVMFHRSRVIDFRYTLPREEELPAYYYGGISEFELIYSQLLNDGIVERAGSAIVEKNSNLFYKIKGFKQLLASGKEKSLVEYFSRMEGLRSIYGAGLVDSEDSIEVHAQALTNLSDVDTMTLRRVAMVTSIPLAVLVGESVKGLNATGANEMETFYIGISNLQENYLLEPLNELVRRLGLGSEVEFIKPEQLTKSDKALLESTLLDNALKLQNLGQDPTSYLNENGFKEELPEEEFGNFEEAPINED